MVDDVKDTSQNTENDHAGVVISTAEEGASESDGNDADVFDTAVSKKSFQVVLSKSKDDAPETADAAEDQQSPAAQSGTALREDEKEDTVKSQIDHGA